MRPSLASALLFTAALALDIPLTFYTDHACVTPSASAPNVTLGLNVCAVTTGLESFILNPVPCTSGNVQNWVFSDTACGDTSDGYYHGANGNNYCFAAYEGAMAALMLTCDSDAGELVPSRPTATTTIVVGAVAVATGTTASASAAPSSSSTSSASGTTPTGTGGNTGSSTTSSGGGWSSLDLGTRIGIIVTLAVGIPPILIGLYAIHQKKKKKKKKKNRLGGDFEQEGYHPPLQHRVFHPHQYPLAHLQRGIPLPGQGPQPPPPLYYPSGTGV